MGQLKEPMTTKDEALNLALEAFKKIRDDKHSYWCIDEEISSIEKALAPIAMEVMKTDEADFWRWWKPYELKDCWRLELVARDAWIASKASLKPKEPEPVELNVTIEGEAAKLLTAMLEPVLDGDDAMAIRLMVGNGHSGYGVYVADDEYPEEGSSLLVNTTPQQRKPWVSLTEEQKTALLDRYVFDDEHDELIDAVDAHLQELNEAPSKPCQTCEALARTVMMDQASTDVVRKPLTDWVAVSDRLPAEEDGEVLVKMRDGRCEIAWATYWHGASNDFAQWTFRDPDEYEAPTHWMLIPAAHGIKGDV